MNLVSNVFLGNKESLAGREKEVEGVLSELEAVEHQLESEMECVQLVDNIAGIKRLSDTDMPIVRRKMRF